MTIGDIKLTPLKTNTEKIEFFKEAKNNTFNSIMESLTKKASEEEDDWRNMSDKEWDRLVKRVDDSTGIGEIEEDKAPGEMQIPWTDTLGKNGVDGFAVMARDIERVSESKSKTPVSDRTFGEASKVPYGDLIKDGAITYNGVTLVPDYDANAICLGDCGQQAVNDGKVISVPLENGGFFKFNVDNMGDIAGIIGMFSAEDAGRIMNAIEQYKFTQSKLNEMEEEAFKAATGRSTIE